MRRFFKLSMAAAFAASALFATATPGFAACKTMGFLVNDYGKDGPTADAQLLLDKHIAAWADKQGVTEYSVGKKTVKCELFLNFIVFDEHTCTARATVCWGGSKQPKTRSAKAKSKTKDKAKNKQAKATSNIAKKASSSPVKTIATSNNETKPSDKPTAKQAEKSETTTAKSDSSATVVETSALPRYVADPEPTTENKKNVPVVPVAGATASKTQAAKAAAIERDTSAVAVAGERAAADRAAAAAERAAAAAERAADAAQKAAEAAQAATASLLASRTNAPIVAPVTPKDPK